MSVPPNAETRLEALTQWRDAALEGSPRAKLSDYHLKRIADSSASDASSVIQAIPGNRTVKSLADEIAEVLSSCDTAEPLAAPMAPMADPRQAAHGSPVPEPRDFPRVEVSPHEMAPPGQRVGSEASPEGVMLRWSSPSPAPDYVVYRIFSGNSPSPIPPDTQFGELLGVLTENQMTDDRPFAKAVRYYSVWANSGRSMAEALASRPALVAFGGVICPVQGWSIVERAGHVTGSWQVPPGAHSVAVYRCEDGEPAGPGNQLHDPGRPSDPNLRGFVDRTGRPLEHYVYRVVVRAEVAGALEASAEVSQVIQIPAIPDQVTDLKVEQTLDSQGKRVFNVAWTPPSIGTVDIYITKEQPDQGLTLEPRGQEALATSILQPEAKTEYPPVEEGGRMLVREVRWQDDWFRAYVTPVTRAGDLVRVGQSVPFARINPIRDAEIRERVDAQVISLSWPEGAAEVAAFVTPAGQPWKAETAGRPQAHISREEYDRFGGLALYLDGKALDVHLVPRAFEGGRENLGDSLTLQYPGIVIIKYRLKQEMGTTGLFKKKRVPIAPRKVEVKSNVDITSGVRFYLVFNPDRLPLSPRDSSTGVDSGPVVQTRTLETLNSEQPTEVLALPETDRRGYFRLFAEAKDPRSPIPLALLDPDVRDLRV